jgi:hypothetical protein
MVHKARSQRYFHGIKLLPRHDDGRSQNCVPLCSLRFVAQFGRPGRRDFPWPRSSGRKRPVKHSYGRWQGPSLLGPVGSGYHAERHANDAQ